MIRRQEIKRILIRGTNWVGDAVLTTPALTALREAFPETHITLLVIPSVAPVFQKNPDIDEVLIYDRQGDHQGFRGRLRLIRRLRSGKYDLAVLLPNSIDAALTVFMAGIPYRYGYNTDGRGWLLRPSIPLPKETLRKHQVAYYLDLLKPLILPPPGVPVAREAKCNGSMGRARVGGVFNPSGESTCNLRLVLSKEERDQVSEAMSRMGICEDDLVIGIHGGATYGTAKRWDPDRFADVARILLERYQAKVLLFGGPGEEPVADEIVHQITLKSENTPHPDGVLFNLAGKTSLRELMAWIARCRLVVTNDSGPMHLATALRVPVVAVFGSTDPVTTGPYGTGHRIIRKGPSCAPCLLRECPTDHQCMNAVMVEDVIEEVDALLSAGAGCGVPRLPNTQPPTPAVFLDRDGTINEDLGYVDTLDRFRLLPDAAEAISRIRSQGFRTILLTNQSGVGRGYFDMGFVHETHRVLQSLLEEKGGRLDGIYVCPHRPEERCLCRKPGIRMILQAAMEHGIDLSRSYLIGDKSTDIEMARRAGLRSVLVLTGYGLEQVLELSRKSPLTEGFHPDHIANNVMDAVEWIIKESGRPKPEHPLKRGEEKWELEAPRRILLIKPSSLGDILHGLPVLKALRDRWPRAWISWVVKEQWSDILQGNPYIDELILLKKNSLTSGFRAFRKRLRQGRHDLAVDLQGLFRSGWIAYLSGAPMRVGFENAREFASMFYTHWVHAPSEMHAVDRNRKVASFLGCGYETYPPPRPSPPRGEGQGGGNDFHFPHFPLYVGRETGRNVSGFLRQKHLKDVRPLIAVFPGGRWMKKRWPAVNFAALCSLLKQEWKAGIILLGSPQEERLLRDIGAATSAPVVQATHLTLREIAALLSRMDLVITNDSGPMHIAAAVETPVVALFGPTDPGRTGPYGQGSQVIRKAMECSPCFRKPCIHDRFICMESITVEEVMEGVRSVFGNR